MWQILWITQDARKFVRFDDFPPVLQLHLMRFDYDYQRDMQIKVTFSDMPFWDWSKSKAC